VLLSAQNRLFVVSWDGGSHLHILYVYSIKMITGFHIRGNGINYWEKITNLHAYSWIFRKDACACCMGGNYCLTFTYEMDLIQ
jgi:hypothetical protein